VVDGACWGFLIFLDFMWVLGVVGMLILVGFHGFLCGLARLFLCILPVYLGAPYAFFF
jgi:predicted transcriptional regulator